MNKFQIYTWWKRKWSNSSIPEERNNNESFSFQMHTWGRKPGRAIIL